MKLIFKNKKITGIISILPKNKVYFKDEMKNYNDKVNIIFSPCSASFDNFRNFEERGEFFNYLIRNKKIRI